jgi:hypothetical protein
MRRTASLVLGLWLSLASVGVSQEKSLIGHWKLAGNARDSSGHEFHGTVAGVEWVPETDKRPGTVARFDGKDDLITVPLGPKLALGKDPFTISAWVHTDTALVDAPGEIVSQYDPQQRRGFNLGFTHNTGVTTSQANFRQLHFGIDDGQMETGWTDHGRPGQAVLIFALAVHDGQLFAGTCESGENQSGHVYRWNHKDHAWVDCGSPAPCNSVSVLAAYRGELYAGVSKYRLGGSALEESQNPHLGGKIFRYAGEKRWIDCGQLPQTEAIGGLVVFGDRLYASSLYRPAGFFRYEGGTNWTSLEVPNGKRVNSLGVYNGNLFAVGYDEGHVYRYDGKAWTDCGRVGPETTTQTYGFATYQGRLYVSTWRDGRVYRYVKDNEWEDAGRLGMELEVMGMLVHNGKLYAGTLPLAEVYRYDGDGHWLRHAQLDTTPDVKYRRVWTMAEYQGRLFCGVLPSGKVLSIQAGANVTYDREVPPGWHHIAAVKGNGSLQLYLDGKRVAESTTFETSKYDLTLDQPLQIGAGPGDFFQGDLSDLRIYRGALTEKEIAELLKAP